MVLRAGTVVKMGRVMPGLDRQLAEVQRLGDCKKSRTRVSERNSSSTLLQSHFLRLPHEPYVIQTF